MTTEHNWASFSPSDAKPEDEETGHICIHCLIKEMVRSNDELASEVWALKNEVTRLAKMVIARS